MRICVDCNVEKVSERKRCKVCVKIFNRKRVSVYYNKQKSLGIKRKRYGIGVCMVCGELMNKSNKNQVRHKRCSISYSKITYNKVSRSKTGNTVGRQTLIDLGFSLTRNLVVHHLDENPENNELQNLSILSASNHRKLHAFLEKQRSLLSKDSSKYSENCWDTLRDCLTKTWLEMVSVKVLKIDNIGQSAAETLQKDIVYIFS